jgi:hypothetical protein
MTETDRLRAVARYYRQLNKRMLDMEFVTLADLFDGIAERHTPRVQTCGGCRFKWPCPDVRAALAVADALGVK